MRDCMRLPLSAIGSESYIARRANLETHFFGNRKNLCLYKSAGSGSQINEFWPKVVANKNGFDGDSEVALREKFSIRCPCHPDTEWKYRQKIGTDEAKKANFEQCRAGEIQTRYSWGLTS